MSIEINDESKDIYEETLWLCMLKAGRPKAAPHMQVAKCIDCKKEIWYDPHMPSMYPNMKNLTKICMGCAGKRIDAGAKK